ncbi:MAG TPA: MBL fold metallo-hydrolase [Gemmatimonadaceae bacterium]|nr:MBL fold metallo-hydrolase [Gemmatimonadaceae bacterium]
MVSRRRQSASDDIPSSVPAATTPGATTPAEDARLSITWIGHSTFLIQSAGLSVLTDPIWSDRASPVQFAGPRRHSAPGLRFDALPAIDAVFLSHDHYDHLDSATVRRLTARYPGAQWIAPIGVGAFLRKRGAANVAEMDWWHSRTLGRISVDCTPAQHFSGRYPWNRNSTLWAGWVIGLAGKQVLFAGDTGLHPEFGNIARRFGPLHVAILPIGAYEPRWFMRPVHMNPEDATEAYVRISETDGSAECVFVPSHWGTFRLTDEPLDEPPRHLLHAWTAARLPTSRLRQLSPGETLALS